MGLYIGSDYVDGVSIYKGGIRQSKNVAPLVTQQTIYPDNGYDSLQSVTISAVTSAIDSNIISENIKDGVTILGVTGSLQSGSAPVDPLSLPYSFANTSGITSTVTITSYWAEPEIEKILIYRDSSYQMQTVSMPNNGDTVTVQILSCSMFAVIANGNIIDNSVTVSDSNEIKYCTVRYVGTPFYPNPFDGIGDSFYRNAFLFFLSSSSSSVYSGTYQITVR